MPSINISEIDLTTGGGSATNLNVVYVPGFMSADISVDEATGKATGAWPLDENKKVDTSNAAKARTPILCKSIKEFETYFGTKPAKDKNGEKDKSYIYAKELLNLGLPVLYESINGVDDDMEKEEDGFNIIYEAFNKDLFENLKDKGNYQFKYLTSGGYPIYDNTVTEVVEGDEGEETTLDINCYTKAADVASSRGDCIVLIDHPNNENIDFIALYDDICRDMATLDAADYCAVFTPWVNINSVTYRKESLQDKAVFSMPPSYAYLSALAKSIRTNASWLAVAGATRGQIPNLYGDAPLNIDGVLTNATAESFQKRDDISINAITDIKPFGYRIWGNRTLKDNSIERNLTATSFLNTRNMICDVKKVVYDACRKYTFEQNNDILWMNFKAAIEPTLNQMKTGAGLSGYKIIKEPVTEKAKLKATIKLYPLYAVEDFDITVQMLDEDIAVS